MTQRDFPILPAGAEIEPDEEVAPPSDAAAYDDTRVVAGLRLRVHKDNGDEQAGYSLTRAGRDYHLQFDEGRWLIQVFDSSINDPDAAHRYTLEEDTLEEAVAAVLEDHQWPPCATCGSTQGPGPDDESAGNCVTCSQACPAGA